MIYAFPLGRCNVWKCLQHTRSPGVRCCGQVVPVDVLGGCGEPVSVSGNVPHGSGRPRQELVLLRAPSKLRNLTGKLWRIRIPHNIQDVCIDSAGFTVWVCYVYSYTAFPPSLPLHSRSKSFRVCSPLTGGSHHGRSMLVFSTLRALGDTVLVACASVATIWPSRLRKGCAYPCGTGSLASSQILCVFYPNEMISPSADHGPDDIAAGVRLYLSR
jgi:hypothetical protein